MACSHYYYDRNEDIDVEEEGGEETQNQKIYQVSLPYTHINITYNSICNIKTNDDTQFHCL